MSDKNPKADLGERIGVEKFSAIDRGGMAATLKNLAPRAKVAMASIFGLLATTVIAAVLEKIAEDRGWTKSLADGTVGAYAQYVAPFLSFVLGPFGWGFAFAAIVFSLPDWPFVERRLKKRDIFAIKRLESPIGDP